MIYAIILLAAVLQGQKEYDHFDLTWNINIAQNIISNPDTLKVIYPDSALWYGIGLNPNYQSFLKKLIKYIKDNFSDQKDISILELIVLPRLDEQRNIVGYNCHIYFNNKINNKTIKFLFIEKEKGKWRIYAIKTDDDKDPFR